MHLIFEYLHIIRSIVDFGLVILIWMVQLIVYPGFSFYKHENLFGWHSYYTPRITVVVAPLMFMQMGISIYFVLFEYSIQNLIYILLVLSTWISTFMYFVPLHQKIEQQTEVKPSVQKLIMGNWVRTIQWTIIFIYGLFLINS